MCLNLYPSDLVGPEINSTKFNMLNFSDGNFTDFISYIKGGRCVLEHLLHGHKK